MLFQPPLGRFIFRADPLHFAPKPRRMVHFPQVHEFMEQNVILDKARGLDEPPIQRDRSAAGTGTPPGPLVAHRDPAHGQLVQFRIGKHSGRQFPCRQAPQMPFNRRTQIRRIALQLDRLAPEPDDATFRVHVIFNFNQFAAKEDFGSDEPLARTTGTRGQALPLAFKPFPVPFSKTMRLGNRTAPGNGHPRRAIRPESQHIPSRPRIMNQRNGNLPAAHR